jgi:hypothetical protein
VPVEVTVPVPVMVSGLSARPRTTGPVTLLLIVLGIDSSLIVLIVAGQTWHRHRF